MIDLLKNYKELQNRSEYVGSVRFEIAKKKFDTLFIKWLFNHQNKVEELLAKSKKAQLQTSKQPPPLFHQRLSLQNSLPLNPNIPMNNSLITPPKMLFQSVDLIQKNSLHESSIPLNLGKSSYFSKSIQQQVKINMEEIPQFYFPNGKSLDQETENSYTTKIDSIFNLNQEVNKKLLNEILQLPCYFSRFLLQKYAKDKKIITKNQFLNAWKQLKCKERHKRAFLLMTTQPNKKYIKIDDFKELLFQIMEVHPGLQFLKDTPEFQEWYSICVINRMFFVANDKNDFQLTYREFKKSSILNSLFEIQAESDINLNRSFFCYEDFYVIYIKFWQLDTVHDFFLTKEEVSKYSGYTLSRKTIERVFSQVARKFQHPQKMTFGDFVWFIFCVEDKSHPKSIEFWFKILDLDNNGIVTGYELQSFFQEQIQRLGYTDNASNDFTYENVVCQMVDILKPKKSLQFTVQDFLKCKNDCGIFINFLTDLNKILAFEQRDAYEERNEKVTHPDWTEWERFVKPEYKRVEQGEEVINWQNDE